MVLFPPCKINIGLYVTGKRPDGYHNIESLFYPVEWNDVLEIVPAPNGISSLTLTGDQVTTDPTNNIVWKALQLIQLQFPHCQAEIHLHKNIPSGAGLGGGSADGAYTLVGLNHVFQLGLNNSHLQDLAAQIGSDCPFFVQSQPTFVEGRGEVLSEHTLSLAGFHILLIHPGLHVSTAKAYEMIKPCLPQNNLKKLSSTDINNWKNIVYNDFEEPVTFMFPEIAKIKSTLYEMGAMYASMSGSGSAVFGIFDSTPPTYDWPTNYRTHVTELK